MGKYKIFLFIFGLVLISISLFVILNLNNTDNTVKEESDYALLSINNLDLKLEIADEPHEQQIGLMNRNNINEGSLVANSEGMIFIFEDETPRTFWMKNTYVTLDIIFLDKDKRVLNIEKDTLVNQTSEVYSSRGNSMYVIELEGGRSDEIGIKVGDRIDLQLNN